MSRMRLLALIVSVVALAAVAPQTAGARTTAVPKGTIWGYVWANDPANASYTPSTTYQANSTGATNTIDHPNTGVYKVKFPNLGAKGGTVDVTAYGGTSDECKVRNWGPQGTTQVVTVVCYDATGAKVDTLFDALYSRVVGTKAFALGYLWANDPVKGSYKPPAAYSYNSKGRTNKVKHTGDGTYLVQFFGLPGGTGTFHVTAFGGGPIHCNIGGWGGFGSGANSGLQASILCADTVGNPVDTQFTVTFADHKTLLGVNRASAYAWANDPSNPSYTPSATYQFDSAGGSITITRSSAGVYSVTAPNIGGSDGDVQVVAYSTFTNQCKVSGWGGGTDLSAGVRCFDASGAPADSYFVFQFVR